MLIVDLDDFCESNTSWELLTELRKKIPGFKVTLFTIPGLCSDSFISEMRAEPWLDMIPHGFRHPTSRECEHWSYEHSAEYLRWVARFQLTKGFKAPGWQISDGMYQALLEKNYFVADQSYNNGRRPAPLPVYLLDSPDKIHGHVGHMGGHNANELSLIMDQILRFKGREFGFVRDAV